MKSKSVVSSLIAKLSLFRAELARRYFKKFPRLNEVNTNVDALLLFFNRIMNIAADIKERYGFAELRNSRPL